MKFTLQHAEGCIEFKVTYSRRRKSLAIIIDPEGEVRVAAPYRTSSRVIMDMVKSKADWIISQQQQMEQEKAQTAKRTFAEGAPFPYLGCEYPLHIRIDGQFRRTAVKLEAGRFIIDTPASDPVLIKCALEVWYREAARQHINSRIEHYRPFLAVNPHRVTIRQQKTRWGSCSSKGNLSFNWRIMMAPAIIIDYIVVHELCHLIHLNHSMHFWNLVESIILDYRERRLWLKKNGTRLSW